MLNYVIDGVGVQLQSMKSVFLGKNPHIRSSKRLRVRIQKGCIAYFVYNLDKGPSNIRDTKC